MRRLTDLISTAVGFVVIAAPALAGPTVAVPEPASIGLLAVGIGSVAWVKFRRRK